MGWDAAWWSRNPLIILYSSGIDIIDYVVGLETAHVSIKYLWDNLCHHQNHKTAKNCTKISQILTKSLHFQYF